MNLISKLKTWMAKPSKRGSRNSSDSLERLVRTPPRDDEWEFEVAFKDGTMAWRGLGGPRTEPEAWATARRICEPHGHTVVMVRRPNVQDQVQNPARKDSE